MRYKKATRIIALYDWYQTANGHWRMRINKRRWRMRMAAILATTNGTDTNVSANG